MTATAPTPSPSRPRALPPEPDSDVRLSVPPEGLRRGDVLLRLPRAEDVEELAPAFADPEIVEAGNLPRLSADDLREALPYLPALADSGRLLPLVVVDALTGRLLGGATLHHLDGERLIVEIGYWLFPHARGRGVATEVARGLAEHAFSLGIERVAAYANVGNVRSERVLERAGYTREGVVRSLPLPDGTRGDKTLFSLLPGE